MSSAKTTDELASNRASVLTELVDVAEGAIVSRVLAKSGGGNVTLFAFDQGQGLSEHTAPFDALVQVVDGRLDLKIGFLHSYPNGELFFENRFEEISEGVLDARQKRRDDASRAPIENQLDKISSMISVGSRSRDLRSCYMSVRTPFTHGTKSM